MSKDDDEDELQTIEEDILPDARCKLAELTSTDNEPGDNPDDERRQKDIEWLKIEIADHERRAASLRKKLAIFAR